MSALTWKDIPRYEGRYQVNQAGEVRSTDWPNTLGHLVRGKPLHPHTSKKDQRRRIYLRLIGVIRTETVSRLVLEAFVGPCPDGYESAHGNGCASDDRLDNLRWATHPENERDKIAHGTDGWVDVGRVLDLTRCGESPKEIAQWLGCSPHHVRRLIRKNSHVQST